MAVDGKEHMAIWKSTKRVRVHIGKYNASIKWVAANGEAPFASCPNM